MKEVIVIFDIGKTNKKVLLFDQNLKIIYQKEQKFIEVKDDDGFPCDDLPGIEIWIKNTLLELIKEKEYKIKAVNFTTYGATLVYIDKNGNPLTPLYNYLKPLNEEYTNDFYPKYGGIEEFSRKTASPALGFLNSGLQILWLKKAKPEIFQRVKSILHFPQYCGYLLHGVSVSEYTSIGCHTAMWNFDAMEYHPWLSDHDISLPEPVSNSNTFSSLENEFNFPVGIGIHDSSASLAPYILHSKEKFILLSTGTWCINMNPFNYEPLTKGQLRNDCLAYMSISQKPVKSSRFFMGHIHDVNLQRLTGHFNVDRNYYKHVKPDNELIKKTSNKGMRFFINGMPANFIDEEVDYGQFKNFDEAYHQFIFDLTLLCKKSIDFIIPENDDIQNLYISGGFAKNELFILTLASLYKHKKVYTSEIDNATALGAALVVSENLNFRKTNELDLGLKLYSN